MVYFSSTSFSSYASDYEGVDRISWFSRDSFRTCGISKTPGSGTSSRFCLPLSSTTPGRFYSGTLVIYGGTGSALGRTAFRRKWKDRPPFLHEWVTVPPVTTFRRNLSRTLLTNRGFDVVLAIFDMRSGDLLSFRFLDVT
jgi:hypothetical protein